MSNKSILSVLVKLAIVYCDPMIKAIELIVDLREIDFDRFLDLNIV
jgi:hypothetical protein